MNKNILTMEMEFYVARDADDLANVYLFEQRPVFDKVDPIYDMGGSCTVLTGPVKDLINKGALYKATMKLEFIENPYERFLK